MYDFDSINDRRNTASLKWNVADGELPMWVADMDFKTSPEIIDALAKRVSHGIFGYSDITDEWYDAYIDWWKNRHSFEMRREWLIFCTGVIPAISSIVRKLTTPAEKVVIMTPVYNIFFNSILNNGRQVSESRLKFDGRSYKIDYDDLESKLSDPQASMMILCNPHNPTGMVWDKETLKKIGDMCKENNVTVVSDEIHCDITDPDLSYIPFASVSENCRENSITCIAPTKAFNIAGLQTAAVSIPNPLLRHKVWRGLNTDEAAEPNAFAVTAAVAAFTRGAPWLDELRNYIFENKQTALSFVKDNIDGITAVPSEATYLLWLYCGKITDSSDRLAEHIRNKTGLYLSAGGQFGGDGNLFLRMNIACPRRVLKDGLTRLKNAVETFENNKIAR